MYRLYLIYTVTLSTDSHSSNILSSSPVMTGILTLSTLARLFSRSANAIMLLFDIPDSPLVL